MSQKHHLPDSRAERHPCIPCLSFQAGMSLSQCQADPDAASSPGLSHIPALSPLFHPTSCACDYKKMSQLARAEQFLRSPNPSEETHSKPAKSNTNNVWAIKASLVYIKVTSNILSPNKHPLPSIRISSSHTGRTGVLWVPGSRQLSLLCVLLVAGLDWCGLFVVASKIRESFIFFQNPHKSALVHHGCFASLALIECSLIPSSCQTAPKSGRPSGTGEQGKGLQLPGPNLSITSSGHLPRVHRATVSLSKEVFQWEKKEKVPRCVCAPPTAPPKINK